MPQVLEEIAGVVRLVPRERVQQWTVDQIVDVPRILEETVEMVRLVPWESVQHRIDEQIVELPLWKRSLRW